MHTDHTFWHNFSHLHASTVTSWWRALVGHSRFISILPVYLICTWSIAHRNPKERQEEENGSLRWEIWKQRVGAGVRVLDRRTCLFFFQIAALKKTSPLSKTSAPAPPPVFEYLVALGSSTSSGDATTLTHILFFSKPFRIVILFLGAAVWFLGCLFILHVAVG